MRVYVPCQNGMRAMPAGLPSFASDDGLVDLPQSSTISAIRCGLH